MQALLSCSVLIAVIACQNPGASASLHACAPGLADRRRCGRGTEASRQASTLRGLSVQVAMVELTREEMSPLTLLTGGASSGAAVLAMLQARGLPRRSLPFHAAIA